MGLNGILTTLGWNTWGMIAMIVSFGAFVGVVIWTLTRPHDEIEADSRLWMDDDK